jgi:hypothetical protein
VPASIWGFAPGLVEHVFDNVELCPVRDHDACLVTSRLSRVQRLPDGLACEGLRQQSTGRPPLAALRAGADPRELVPEAVDVHKNDLGRVRARGGVPIRVARFEDARVSDGVGHLGDDWSESVLLGEHRASLAGHRRVCVRGGEEFEGAAEVPAPHRVASESLSSSGAIGPFCRKSPSNVTPDVARLTAKMTSGTGAQETSSTITQ